MQPHTIRVIYIVPSDAKEWLDAKQHATEVLEAFKMRPTRDNRDGSGVSFIYQLQQDDLDSAARFESGRQ